MLMGMDAHVCLACRQRDRRIAELQAEVERLQQELDEARRTGKRQAAPFAKQPPKAEPKRPGRKAGDAYGRKGHRRPPSAEQIDEVHEAPLPDVCPECGGAMKESHVAHQYQVEIPRRPIHREVNVHVGHCRDCGRRVQGRHALQTSDALGAAAAQLGPDAQAAVVELNKQAGLPHGKISRCLESFFGIPLTRGGSAQVVLRGARRAERPCGTPWPRGTGPLSMRPAGTSAGTRPGCMPWSGRRPQSTSWTRREPPTWRPACWAGTTRGP
jgi:transposase